MEQGLGDVAERLFARDMRLGKAQGEWQRETDFCEENKLGTGAEGAKPILCTRESVWSGWAGTAFVFESPSLMRGLDVNDR
jgi:hypothetical protein